MQTNDFFLEADNLCKYHFILDRYGLPLCNFYHRYLPQNLIKIQLIVSKAKRVHANYALLYALYTDYIKIPSVCVLSSKELFTADTSISLLAHGRYA
jgi:hypothetical protein